MTLADALTDPRRKYGPPEHLHRVVPGMTRARLYREVFSTLGRGGVVQGAEIGVADGRNSLTMCESIPGLQLLCVDPWEPYKGNPRGGPRDQHERNYALARERLKPFDVRFCRQHSMDAVQVVPAGSLDAVYLDGNHSFDWIMQDLIEWSKRVRSGGVIAGHDLYHFAHAGVVEAVEAYTRAHGITGWHICDEREPSFWWVKP